jgi:hypothetical protein
VRILNLAINDFIQCIAVAAVTFRDAIALRLFLFVVHGTGLQLAPASLMNRFGIVAHHVGGMSGGNAFAVQKHGLELFHVKS